MFFQRRRVEEDLERIRKANLPAAAEDSGEAGKEPERIGAKDILAMIIAIFSIVLPYVLIFIAVMALLLFSLYYFMG